MNKQDRTIELLQEIHDIWSDEETLVFISIGILDISEDNFDEFEPAQDARRITTKDFDIVMKNTTVQHGKGHIYLSVSRKVPEVADADKV